MKRFFTAAGIGLVLALIATSVYADGPPFSTNVNNNHNVDGFHHVCEPADGAAPITYKTEIWVPLATAPEMEVPIRYRIMGRQGVHGRPYTVGKDGEQVPVEQDFTHIRGETLIPPGQGAGAKTALYTSRNSSYSIRIPFQVYGDKEREQPEIVEIWIKGGNAAAMEWMGKQRITRKIKIWDYADCVDGKAVLAVGG